MIWIVASIGFCVGAFVLNLRLAAGGGQHARYAVPLIFGVAILVMWEGLVRGLGISPIILPPPSAIAVRFASSLPVLWQDFVQTFVKGALTGYVLGCASAVLVAVLIDRSPFFQRGLLPVGNFVAALPIIGTALEKGRMVN